MLAEAQGKFLHASECYFLRWATSKQNSSEKKEMIHLDVLKVHSS
jgi:hypothetical protein